MTSIWKKGLALLLAMSVWMAALPLSLADDVATDVPPQATQEAATEAPAPTAEPTATQAPTATPLPDPTATPAQEATAAPTDTPADAPTPTPETEVATAAATPTVAVHPYLTFAQVQDGLAVVGCDVACEAASVPATFNGQAVTEVAANAFEDCIKLETAEVAQGVLRIGDKAFAGCELLTRVALPDTIEEIAEDAFVDCPLLAAIEAPEGSFAAQYAAALFAATATQTPVATQPADTAETTVEPEATAEATAEPTAEATAEVTAEPTADEAAAAALLAAEAALTAKAVPTVSAYITLTGPDTLCAGASATLTAAVYSSAAISKVLAWSTSAPALLSVSSTGRVTVSSTVAEAATVTVFATLKANTDVRGAWEITLYPRTKSIEITPATILLDVDKPDTTVACEASVNPAGSSTTLRWASSAPTVATVSADGTVTGTGKLGTATITATATDGSVVKKSITVKAVRPVTGVQWVNTPSTPKLAAGKTLTLKAAVIPANATNLKLTWASSNTSVATVSSTGVVTARSVAGATTVDITVKAAENASYAQTITLNVLPAATSVTLSLKSKTLGVGDPLTLTATVGGATGHTEGVVWRSTKPAVATVADGIVTAVANGVATIYATADDGSGKAASMQLTVATKMITLSIQGYKNLSLVRGKYVQLKATVAPATTSNKTLTWRAVTCGEDWTPNMNGEAFTASKAVTVTSAGRLSAASSAAVGTKALVRCEARDDSGVVSDWVQVTVAAVPTAAEAIAIQAAGTAVDKGVTPTLTLNATLKNTATPVPVTWKVSSTRLATIAADAAVPGSATLTPLANGTVQVTAVAMDGSNRTATCKITITTGLTALAATVGTVTLAKGRTATLKVVPTPADAVYKLTWSSADASKVSVDAYGNIKVKAITAETGVEITATTSGTDEPKTVEFLVIGTGVPASVRIATADNRRYLNLYSSDTDTLRLSATVVPLLSGEPALAAVKWKTANAKVATVDAVGLVTAVGAGTVAITATTTDGIAKMATVSLTVVRGPDALAISGASNLAVGAKATLSATTVLNGAKAAVRWSSNSAYVSITSTGVVTVTGFPAEATEAQTATITATSLLDATIEQTHTLTFYSKATLAIIAVSGNDYISLTEDDPGQLQLACTVTPATACQQVVWASGNTALATVDQDGLVTAAAAKRQGTVLITATAMDGSGQVARFYVRLYRGVQGITVSGATELISGNATTLQVVATPADASYPAVTWSTDAAAGVAEISASGRLTTTAQALETTVVVTATSVENESVSGSISITLYPAFTGIAVTPVSADLNVTVPAQTTVKLTGTVSPEGAGGYTGQWISSDSTIATVDVTGLVTAVSSGVTSITYRIDAIDGSHMESTASVTVHPIYRALLVGQSYPGSRYELSGPPNDAAAIRKMLLQYGVTKYNGHITLAPNLTGNGMLSTIASTFADATTADVSLFYYSGHGVFDDDPEYLGALCGTNMSSDSAYVTATELRTALDQIQGTKVVLIDACFSGNLIGKSTATIAAKASAEADATAESAVQESTTKEAMAAFNSAFVSAFATGMSAKSTLNTGGYYVMTAAHSTELSWEVSFSGKPMGIFTYYLTRGCGWNGASNTANSKYADTNSNGILTLNEAYTYAKNMTGTYIAQYDISQTAQVYPTGSSYAFLQ